MMAVAVFLALLLRWCPPLKEVGIILKNPVSFGVGWFWGFCWASVLSLSRSES